MPSEQQPRTIPEAIQIGMEHHQAGRLPEAERVYLRVLEVDPNNPDILHLLGAIAHQVGRNEISVQLIAKALRFSPSNPVFLNTLGEANRALGQLKNALANYEKALAIKPDYAAALSNRGIALHGLGRSDEALASYDKAINIDPGLVDAFNNRGNGLLDLKRYGEALASFDMALTIKPGYAPVLANRGNALRELKRYDEALASYDDALAIKPDHVEALDGRGIALYELGRHNEALASFGEALAIKPGFATTRLNESICRLLNGDFERGLQEYEWRWKCAAYCSEMRDFSQPLWLGKEDPAGKTILLHAEQGLGDTIQFARYASLVAPKGARVILEVQPPLTSLLSSISGVDLVLSRGDPLPEFDFHCPLLSLPLAFSTRLETIPATIPYLSAEETAVSAWRRKLAVQGMPLVGLCWRGSATYKKDRDRSLRLAQLRTLLVSPSMRFVSLQKELDEEERAMTAGMENFVHPGADFNDTAELIGALDLVISVDTAWAHWAGAIGKPLWVLLPRVPHWCWLLDRDDSPWYPSARLFRQIQPGDWDKVIESVEEELPRLRR